MEQKELIIGLGIPTYGGVSANFFDFYNDLTTALNAEGISYLKLHLHGDSLITRSRNVIISEYYYHTQKYDLTHLFFLDSDIQTDVNQVIRMIKTTQEPHIDVIGAYIPIKEFDGELTRQPRTYIHTYNTEFDNSDLGWGLLRVERLTTGMLLLTDQVVQALIRNAKDKGNWYYADVDDDKIIYEVFKTEINKENGRRVYLSEDWYVCNVIRELGFNIVVDLRVDVHHRGFYDYKFIIENNEDKG